MDYKELIEQLKNIRFLYADDGLKCASICKDAATAIETLLAERDAAQHDLRDLQATLDMYGGEYGITEAFRKAEERSAALAHFYGDCKECVYSELTDREHPCCDCFFTGGMDDCWQWRGPQKGKDEP